MHEEFARQVQLAREVLETKGAPIEGTAAGHLVLALESVVAAERAAAEENRKMREAFERGYGRKLNN